MRQTQRRLQIVTVGAVAVVWIAFWVVIAVESRMSPDTTVQLVLFSTLIWAAAALLVLKHWLSGTAWQMSTVDAPGRLLALVVTALPERRREWGMAMLAELAEVQGRPARWRFALSSVRAALLLPPADGWPVIGLVTGAVVAATLAAGPVVGGVMPEMGLFAAGFVGVFGVLGLVTLARSSRIGIRLWTVLPALVGIGAVGAAVATTVIFLRRDPSADVHFSAISAAILAAVLASCLWIAVTSPEPTRGNRFAPLLGAGGGLAVGAVFVVLNQAAYNVRFPEASREAFGLLAVLWMIFAPAVALFTVATAAGFAGRSFGSGLQAGAWAFAVGTPLMYGLFLLQSLHMYAINGGLLLFGDGAPEAENLSAASSFCLVLAVIFGTPFAVFGAAAGSELRRGARPPTHARHSLGAQ